MLFFAVEDKFGISLLNAEELVNIGMNFIANLLNQLLFLYQILGAAALPGGGGSLTVSLRKGTWHDAWIAHGLVNQTIKPGVPVQMPVVVVIQNNAYTAERALTYTATAGKTGSGK